MKAYPWKLGLYLSPTQLLTSTNDLICLMDQLGIDHVILRTGFNVQQLDPLLSKACDRLRRRRQGLCLLVGGWWGQGIEPGSASLMPCVTGLPSPTPASAHESQWSMYCPLGPWSQIITTCACDLIQKYQPEAICFTHARFHHPADIPGLFSIGSSTFQAMMRDHECSASRLQSALRLFEERLADLHVLDRNPPDINIDIPHWMDRVAQVDVFSRWFSLRCDVICQAVDAIFSQIRQAIRNPPILGVNAMNPIWSSLAGQDYRQLASICDFIQPLTGYIFWHFFQPMNAWVHWWSRCVQLERLNVKHLLATLLALEPSTLWRFWDQALINPNDGHQDLVLSLMGSCHQRMTEIGLPRQGLPVVLRGEDWSPMTIQASTRFWHQSGYPSVLYQGHQKLSASIHNKS